MILTAVLCYYNKTSDIINLQEKNVYSAHGFGNSSQKVREPPDLDPWRLHRKAIVEGYAVEQIAHVRIQKPKAHVGTRVPLPLSTSRTCHSDLKTTQKAPILNINNSPYGLSLQHISLYRTLIIQSVKHEQG